jgi:aryl-alcohol dehydrogenase-like predicted oxidoreductase
MYRNSPRLDRRRFLQSVAATAGALGIAPGAVFAAQDTQDESKLEWRNRQPEMAYRRLGRTNFMISEVVSGGDPIRPDNYRQLELALEMGLNYLDMAPAYGGGDCERAYANIVSTPSKRDRVFMNTKISGFSGVRNRLYREIFEGLPSEKKAAIQKRAEEMIAERGVAKPGYFFEYYPGMARQLPPTYLTVAMMRDYRHRVEGSTEFQRVMTQSLEESLKRVGTDHFDIVMCPHGAAAPEEVQIPEIREIFEDLKKQGKVRYLGVSSHNDPAGVLRGAVGGGYYDVVMAAYNVINGGYMDEPIRRAAENDVGFIGMKVAMAVATQHKSLQPTPQWRIEKVNRLVPGDDKPPVKAYLWALQNPRISAVISNLWNEDFVRENLGAAGRKVELQAG